MRETQPNKPCRELSDNRVSNGRLEPIRLKLCNVVNSAFMLVLFYEFIEKGMRDSVRNS